VEINGKMNELVEQTPRMENKNTQNAGRAGHPCPARPLAFRDTTEGKSLLDSAK
jgi:hypothetical protein